MIITGYSIRCRALAKSAPLFRNREETMRFMPFLMFVQFLLKFIRKFLVLLVGLRFGV
jgi:hypothetical protein